MKRRANSWIWLDAICAAIILAIGEIEIQALNHALSLFLSISVLVIGYAAIGIWLWHDTAAHSVPGHLQYIRHDQQATIYRWISDEEQQ